MDSYWWISFETQTDRLELDQDLLFELGASGVEELESPSSAGSGAATPVTLGSHASAQPLRLKGFFGTADAWSLAMETFADRSKLEGGEAPVEDWDQSWRDRQTPVEVTPSLTVVPPWVNYPKSDSNQVDRSRHIIRLEAKMAFGTGSHESTRIAALLLESIAMQNRSVLDIGTGTGILALYAAMLGASQVLALDIDPVVGPCLKENLELNPPPSECRFRTLIGETSALDPAARFDVVICNMIRTELWPFREELRGRLLPGGRYVVSGQRLEDKSHFLEWQKISPFQIIEEIEIEGWWGFTGGPA